MSEAPYVGFQPTVRAARSHGEASRSNSGVAGITVSWRPAASPAMSTPPGFRAPTSPVIAAFGSARCSSSSRAWTRSKSPPGAGSRETSCRLNSTVGAFVSRRRFSRSVPRRRAPGPRRDGDLPGPSPAPSPAARRRALAIAQSTHDPFPHPNSASSDPHRLRAGPTKSEGRRPAQLRRADPPRDSHPRRTRRHPAAPEQA
jgi:hypothetical protein